MYLRAGDAATAPKSRKHNWYAYEPRRFGPIEGLGGTLGTDDTWWTIGGDRKDRYASTQARQGRRAGTEIAAHRRRAYQPPDYNNRGLRRQ